MKNNRPKTTVIKYSIFFFLCLAVRLSRAQAVSDSLLVNKIIFASSEAAKDASKTAPALTVTYSPEYLLATQNNGDGNATSWLIWHERQMLLQINDRQGLPMSYDIQLKTNVFLPGEAIDTAANITRHPGEWDNVNEYNGPGTGRISFTTDTLTIAGYATGKAVINYSYPPACTDGLIRSTTIWYSRELPPFFLPSFTFLQKIPGAALMICIETTDGEKAYYKATEVTKQQQPVSFFRPSKDIRILYPPTL
ncbi:hypothetical protein HF324_11475 [Chitinophaga oryzae]|uniref:GLPGLI family protein n=1 Tax=Chitinophaga oryzae TaxID=2725414 RepID=A0ABX6LHX1_9BACT|nr:hypothetical protein [Chitinophaga oryzae]QJB38453.1 hypothetical protein HF324_11475 [Chitinophaga oryzae]